MSILVAFRSGGLMLKTFCQLFGHRRSKLHARREGAVWLSRCVTCKTPLVRLDPGQWVETSSPAGKEFLKAAEQLVLRPSPASCQDDAAGPADHHTETDL